MNIYSISALCFTYGVVLIAILALQRRRDVIAGRFFIFSIAVSGWGFLFSLWINQSYSFETTLKLARISQIFVLFIPVTWLHFVMEFVSRKEPFRFFFVLNYLVALALALLFSKPALVIGLHAHQELKYVVTPGMAYHLHTITFFSLVPYGLWRLLVALRNSNGSQRKSLGLLIAGTALGFSAGACIYLAFYAVPCPLYFMLLMPLYPILAGISLIRYGLFDVQEIADAFQREKLAVLGTMAASLNHELKNPLFVIRGKAESYLDSLERGKYSNEEICQASQSAINPILNHANRALDIIQRFTDFARPFNVKASKERVVLSEVFKDVQELVSSEFQGGNIKLAHNLTNGVAVMGNRRHIEEILSNLIINACHAIGNSSGQVSVNAYSDQKKTRIEISDTGPGIPKENLPRVFEPFFTTKGPKGSGLGLYITKQLVERNSGIIAIRSSLGKGTTFLLEFATL